MKATHFARLLRQNKTGRRPSCSACRLALRPEQRQSQHLGALDFDGPSRNVHSVAAAITRCAQFAPHRDSSSYATGCGTAHVRRRAPLFLLIAVMSWPHPKALTQIERHHVQHLNGG